MPNNLEKLSAKLVKKMESMGYADSSSSGQFNGKYYSFSMKMAYKGGANITGSSSTISAKEAYKIGLKTLKSYPTIHERNIDDLVYFSEEFSMKLTEMGGNAEHFEKKFRKIIKKMKKNKGK